MQKRRLIPLLLPDMGKIASVCRLVLCHILRHRFGTDGWKWLARQARI